MSTRSQPRYRARIAPRSRGGGGLGSRIQWDRFGRIVLLVVLFVVLASYIKPGLEVFGTWRESHTAEQRLDEVKAENQRLSRRAEALQTDAAALNEARKLGLVGEGETAYTIKGLP